LEIKQMAEIIAAPCRWDFPRRNVFIWVSVILFTNQLISTARGSASVGEMISGLFTVGVFQYMAWYAIFRLLGASHLMPTARRKDVLIIAALLMLLFLPTSRMIWVVAAGVAVYLSICSRDDLSMRAAGIVLAALSAQEFWGHVFFQLIATPLLRAETAVVGTILQLTRRGAMWHDNIITMMSGHAIVLYPYCSSFHNLSLALLCWVTITKLHHLNWRDYDFLMGGLIAGTTILLNTARLYLMALNVDAYDFWHNGAGFHIFEVGLSVSVLLLTLYGTRPVARPL
jgi:hypothetical protein